MDLRRLSLLCMGVGVGVLVYGILVLTGISNVYPDDQAITPIIAGVVLIITSYFLFKRTQNRR